MVQQIVLRDLVGDELARYLVHLEASYAQDMHEQGGVPLEEARARSRADTDELFPDGRPAEHHRLWRAVDGEGAPVGVLWLARREVGTAQEHAWIFDIEVDPDRRGQGWGRLLMQEAERIAREWEQTSLRLNVFGDNEVARNLYRSQGFREQQVVMSKAL